MLCVRDIGQPAKFHRADVVKMHARTKHMAKEKVGTGSTNTVIPHDKASSITYFSTLSSQFLCYPTRSVIVEQQGTCTGALKKSLLLPFSDFSYYRTIHQISASFIISTTTI